MEKITIKAEINLCGFINACFEYINFSEKDLKITDKLKDNTKHFVILSGYKNKIYEKLLSDWWTKDFQAMTRGGVRTETVWCNFKPSEVHYHTFAGKDRTDRQRIKRKAERLANKFKLLPNGERQAILNSLLMIE